MKTESQMTARDWWVVGLGIAAGLLLKNVTVVGPHMHQFLAEFVGGAMARVLSTGACAGIGAGVAMVVARVITTPKSLDSEQ